MDRSPAHEAALLAAARLPTLYAGLALLAEDSQRAEIRVYGGDRPTPGETPTGDLLVTLPLTSTAGLVDEGLYQIQLEVPVEAQISGADPAIGTDATWARIIDGSGGWWADVSVSDELGAGELKIQSTTLFNGAFCRLISGVIQG